MTPRMFPTGSSIPLLAGLLAGMVSSSACHPPPSDSPVDSGTGDDTSAEDDTGDGPPPGQDRCPADMRPVTSGDEVVYCIDPYEVTVVGELGDADPLLPGGAHPEAVATSEAGVIPTVLVSFLQAREICAQTPVVDADGIEVGFRHLATSQEWEDAGDGQVGDGGLTYPYGDTFEDGVCATLNADGEQVFDELQPTGSLPGCVSPFEIWDQVGNAWEWSDPGLSTDIADWTARAEREGIAWWTDEEDHLFLADPDHAARIELLVVPFPGLDAQVLEDGQLCTDIGDNPWPTNDPVWGYALIDRATSAGLDVEPFLPVRLVWDDELVAAHGCLPVLLFGSRDGYPITDKRGGAYYVGETAACRLSSHFVDHTAETQAAIGFRCACEPLPG